MILFGRSLSVYVANIFRLHVYFWYCLKCILLFKRPFRVLYAYLTQTTPPERRIELRCGLQIILSDCRDDISTVFLIFVREDYGKIASDSIVIDIGANIGVFALYAAYHKAKRVYAYEAGSETFHYLVRNVTENGLETVIFPVHAAVTGTEGNEVKFPLGISASSKIITDENSADFEYVKTKQLSTIVEQEEVIDLLKLDCEGAEYEILFAAGAAVKHIHIIKLEYHPGPIEQLVSFLQSQDFIPYHTQKTNAACGLIWLRKPITQ